MGIVQLHYICYERNSSFSMDGESHIKSHKFFNDYAYDVSGPWEAQEATFSQLEIF